MKHILLVISLAVLVLTGSFLAIDPPVAAAGGYYGGGGYHGGYYGGGGYYHGGYYGGTRVYIGGGWWGWPGWWGPGWWGAPYSYPYNGGAPVVVQPAPPTEYIQQAPPAAQNWYYCPNPQGFYPYVTNCTVPWIPVPPQPAAAGVHPPTP